MKSTKSATEINHLLERNRETELSYLKAVEFINDPELKDRFANFAHQRFGFGLDLKKSIVDSARRDPFWSRISTSLNSRWIQLKGLVSRNPDKIIIQCFVDGEQRALNDYESLMQEENIPDPAKRMLSRHRESIKNILHYLQSFQKFNLSQ